MSEIKAEFTTGTYVSAVGHAGLIGWLLLGWGLSSDPLPFEVTQVSVVSGAEYAALVEATTPAATTDQPTAPSAPAVEEPVPPVAGEEPVTPPAAETPPVPPAEEQPPEPLEPLPVPADVEENAPVRDTPPAPVTPDLPIVTDTPQEEAADRVADVPTPPRPPEADVAPEVRDEVVEAPAEIVTPQEEAQEAAAPEEAASEVVTEADIPSGALDRAPRPPARPANLRPPPPPAVPAETATADSANVETPTPPATDSTVDDLLSDLTSAPAVTDAPTGNPGPPMTEGQRADFGFSVQQCWRVDTGSEASRVTVQVTFTLGRDRRVVGNVIEMVGNSGGSNGAVNAAFEAARRAILRCQSEGGGFPLDDAQFEQWREVRMTFDPTQMRVR